MYSEPTVCNQLFEALISASKDGNNHASIERALELIDEGGKDFLMNFDFDVLDDPYYDDIINDHLLIRAINMDVPLVIMEKMIEIGGKDFLLKPDNTFDGGNTPLVRIFSGKYVFERNDESRLQLLQLMPKLLEVGGRDLVMKRNGNYGNYALHYSCQNSIYDAATKEQIEIGGNEIVMTKDSRGDTALHHASRGERISFKSVKLMIEVGGRDLLKEKNNEGRLAVHEGVLTQDLENGGEILETLALLIKEGIYNNVGGEFSLGGLFEDESVVDIVNESSEYALEFGANWFGLIFPVLLQVLRLINNESPKKFPPLLQSLIMIKAPKFVIMDVMGHFFNSFYFGVDSFGRDALEGVVSVKDSLGRCAIDVAIEMKRPFDEGLEEILGTTAWQKGLHILHCAAHHGLPWTNGMEELVVENLDDALNVVNEKTGLKLFMTAAIGGDLDTIYSLIRKDPMSIY